TPAAGRLSASASHTLYSRPEAEAGSPSKNGTAIPSTIVVMLTMPDGGRMVIGAREEDVASDGGEGDLPAGRYLRLSVGDDGDGMDERILLRAPEALFTTKDPDRGAGLGLPMVSGFTEQSGGRFVLRSKKGRGTVAEL